MPRNIDPAVSKIPNVFLFDIDDLESVISSNIREREREARAAELIVQSEVMQFQQKLRLMDIGPSIGALRQNMQDVARAELARQRKRLGQLTRKIRKPRSKSLLMSTVNKISHPILNQMRRFYETSESRDCRPERSFGLEE